MRIGQYSARVVCGGEFLQEYSVEKDEHKPISICSIPSNEGKSFTIQGGVGSSEATRPVLLADGVVLDKHVSIPLHKFFNLSDNRISKTKKATFHIPHTSAPVEDFGIDGEHSPPTSDDLWNLCGTITLELYEGHVTMTENSRRAVRTAYYQGDVSSLHAVRVGTTIMEEKSLIGESPNLSRITRGAKRRPPERLEACGFKLRRFLQLRSGADLVVAKEIDLDLSALLLNDSSDLHRKRQRSNSLPLLPGIASFFEPCCVVIFELECYPR